jgi:hypothetical protein
VIHDRQGLPLGLEPPEHAARVHPVADDFGWPVVARCALFAGLGLVLPFLVLSKLVPVSCPRCRGPAYLGTESTFFRKMLAKYHYRCRSCGHVEEMNFDHRVRLCAGCVTLSPVMPFALLAGRLLLLAVFVILFAGLAVALPGLGGDWFALALGVAFGFGAWRVFGPPAWADGRHG